MASLPRSIFRKFSTSGLRNSSASAEAYNKDADKARELWKKITYFVAFPAIAIAMANTYIMEMSHHHEREEFVPYEHLRLRGKKYPWGDGNKTFFHNKELNPLPTGYED